MLARAVGQETEGSTSAKHVKPPSRTVFAALIPVLNVCSRHSSAGESRGLTRIIFQACLAVEIVKILGRHC